MDSVERDYLDQLLARRAHAPAFGSLYESPTARREREEREGAERRAIETEPCGPLFARAGGSR